MERKANSIFFWLSLIIAPFILVIIELFHPANFTLYPGAFQFLSNENMHQFHHHGALLYFGPYSWFVIHMIQTPCLVLAALGLIFLTKNITPEDGKTIFKLTWLTRAMLFIFFVYYSVLDSIAGIGYGKLLEIIDVMQNEHALNAQQLLAIQSIMNQYWIDPWVGGLNSVISQLGSWSVLLASFLLASILYITKRINLANVILLATFGCFLQISHASPMVLSHLVY